MLLCSSVAVRGSIVFFTKSLKQYFLLNNSFYIVELLMSF